MEYSEQYLGKGTVYTCENGSFGLGFYTKQSNCATTKSTYTVSQNGYHSACSVNELIFHTTHGLINYEPGVVYFKPGFRHWGLNSSTAKVANYYFYSTSNFATPFFGNYSTWEYLGLHSVNFGTASALYAPTFLATVTFNLPSYAIQDKKAFAMVISTPNVATAVFYGRMIKLMHGQDAS